MLPVVIFEVGDIEGTAADDNSVESFEATDPGVSRVKNPGGQFIRLQPCRLEKITMLSSDNRFALAGLNEKN